MPHRSCVLHYQLLALVSLCHASQVSRLWQRKWNPISYSGIYCSPAVAGSGEKLIDSLREKKTLLQKQNKTEQKTTTKTKNASMCLLFTPDFLFPPYSHSCSFHAILLFYSLCKKYIYIHPRTPQINQNIIYLTYQHCRHFSIV